MELRKELGKIDTIFFGVEDGKIGLHMTFTFGASSGVSWSEAHWDPEQVKVNVYSNWNESNRSNLNDTLIRKISYILSKAKAKKIEELKDKPVELTFDGNMLKCWRILTEVL